jgi:hypothetical protein
MAAEAGQGLLSAVSSYAKGDMGGAFKSAMGIVKVASGNNAKANKYAKATRSSPADVVRPSSFYSCLVDPNLAILRSRGVAAKIPKLVLIRLKLAKRLVL